MRIPKNHENITQEEKKNEEEGPKEDKMQLK